MTTRVRHEVGDGRVTFGCVAGLLLRGRVLRARVGHVFMAGYGGHRIRVQGAMQRRKRRGQTL